MLTVALPLPPSVRDRWRVVGLTVDQYDFLIEQGRLPETTAMELIDGQIVRKDRSHAGDDPMTIGVLHACAIDSLNELKEIVRRESVDRALVRTQSPIVVPPSHEPAPDGVIVRGTKDDYLRRRPSPSDVLCVIEAADSSLSHDRTVKREVYAAAGIPVYIIMNLIDRVLERHADPAGDDYCTVSRIGPGDVIHLPIGDGRTLGLPAERLIPPTLI